MILFFNQNEYILLIGRGLIGTAIINALNQIQSLIKLFETNYPWGSHLENQKNKLNQVFNIINELHSSNTINILWCAGKSGFFSDEQQTHLEFEDFKRAVDLLGKKSAEINLKVKFILISSAGGFFEGQRHVQTNSKIHLSRPYGLLKLNQENYLKKIHSFPIINIFRLSSVYGYIAVNKRMGLIPTLILLGLKQKTIEINGNFDSIRDYIWVEDIAFYIANIIKTMNFKKSLITTLASARPSTILEIKEYVEQVIGRKTYIVFQKNQNNSANITYSPQTIPQDFEPSELFLNIKKIYTQFISGDTYVNDFFSRH